MVEDAVSGAKIAPLPPALAVACLSLCLQWGGGLVSSLLALLWYSLSPLLCVRTWQCLRLELFAGKFSLFLSISFFLCLWLSHILGC